MKIITSSPTPNLKDYSIILYKSHKYFSTIIKYYLFYCLCVLSVFNTDVEKDVKTKSKFIIAKYKKHCINVRIKNEHDYVQVKLYPFHIIVLPLGWSYILDTECELTELNDLLHKLLL